MKLFIILLHSFSVKKKKHSFILLCIFINWVHKNEWTIFNVKVNVFTNINSISINLQLVLVRSYTTEMCSQKYMGYYSAMLKSMLAIRPECKYALWCQKWGREESEGDDTQRGSGRTDQWEMERKREREESRYRGEKQRWGHRGRRGYLHSIVCNFPVNHLP